MSGSVCTRPSSVIVRQKYSDNISRLSESISVLYINCVGMVELGSALSPQCTYNKSFTHFRDLLFRQFCLGDSILSIDSDRDEFP